MNASTLWNTLCSTTRKGKVHYYAVCPACENPIQLIGLFKPEKNTRRPYGKHTGKPIQGFSYFAPEEYEYCPYFHPSKIKSRVDSKRSKLNIIALTIVKRLREEFDDAVALIENICGFSISYGLAEDMLSNYLIDEGYLYFTSNIQNTPWMFAFRTAVHNLFGQQIKDIDLKKAIENRLKNAYFDPDYQRLVSNPKGAFYKVTFMFSDYECKTVDDDTIEAMQLNVYGDSEKPIWKKDIIFDHEYATDFLSKRTMHSTRKRKFLEISKRLIDERFPDLDELIARTEREITHG